jgi:hypothetical protein
LINPCINDGECISVNTSFFRCECKEHYIGQNCEIKKVELHSEIFNYDEFEEFKRSLDLTNIQNWSLIYQASIDGFDASSFHSKCDRALNTLIVIKTTNSYIFGGYTEADWSGKGWKNDPNAFLFSLTNKENKFLKIYCNRTLKAIYANSNTGPIFGSFDIFVSDNSNLNKKSTSNLGNHFKHPNFRDDSKETKTFLAGSEKFTVEELEVYTLSKNSDFIFIICYSIILLIFYFKFFSLTHALTMELI